MIKILLVLSLFASPALSQTVIKIVDGDTFKAAWDGDTVTVRLCGIDTPESKKNKKAKKDAERSGEDLVKIVAYGKMATTHLRALMPVGSKVKFEFDVRETDKYSRLLAYVYRDGFMINERLVEDGYATTMTIAPNVKYADRFRAAEAKARDRKRGLWK